MISSAISADLGRQEALRGSQEALATVTGIVDGTGSIGAAGGQVNKNSLEGKPSLFKKKKNKVQQQTDMWPNIYLIVL